MSITIISIISFVVVLIIAIMFTLRKKRPDPCTQKESKELRDKKLLESVEQLKSLITGSMAQRAEQLESKRTGCTAQEKSQKLNLDLSIAHPKLLSKRFSSRLYLNIFSGKNWDEMIQRLKKELGNEFNNKYDEQTCATELTAGLKVVINLSSPDIDFSEKVTLQLDQSINKVIFIAKPKDTCYPGNHLALLTISDVETGFQLEQFSIELKVVDFVIGHISRPLLSKTASFILGLGSVATYLLTLLGQIDTTVGLTSGTAAGIMVAFIYGNFSRMFQLSQTPKTLKGSGI